MKNRRLVSACSTRVGLLTACVNDGRRMITQFEIPNAGVHSTGEAKGK